MAHSDVQIVLGPSTGVGAAPDSDHPPLPHPISHSVVSLDVASGRMMKSTSMDFTHGCNRLQDQPVTLSSIFYYQELG